MSTTAAVPRLTLGLPVYNGERYLAASLDALLAQTFTDFQLIISDNGSTDRTGEIARHYEAADSRVRYVHHPENRGSTFNHNYVVEQARGEFFKWVSDDDLYAPDLLQRCIDALDSRPEIVLAHAWTAFIDDAGTITDPIEYALTTDVPDPVERFRSVLYTDGGDDIYGVIRMSVLRQIAPFGSYHWADRTFVGELALHGPFHNVPDYLYFRRDHPMRTSRVGRNNIRRRCARLDPARGNRWRHPVVRLVGEYLLAFLAQQSRRAPISPRDRWRCRKELAVWVAASCQSEAQASTARRALTRRPIAADHQAMESSHGRAAGGQCSVNQPVRRVALYGYLGSGNIGNDASLETVLAWLKSDHPDVEVRCITIAPDEVTARYGLPSVPLSWHSSGQSRSRVTEASRKLLGRLIDVPRSYALAGSVDAVIVPGMGVLEESLGESALGLAPRALSYGRRVPAPDRRFVLLDVGAEWAVNPLTRRLYVAAVRRATHVSYRDRSSAAAMARAGARDPEAIAPDLAFAHPAPRLANPESSRIVVGVMAYYGQAGRPDTGRRGAPQVRRDNGRCDGAARATSGDQVVLVGGDRVDVDVARDVRAAVLRCVSGLAR